MRSSLRLASCFAVLLALALGSAASGAEVEITEPPESFFELMRRRDRDVAREFYKKYATVQGLPVAAAEEVSDRALARTCEIVQGMLAGRPDVIQEMIDDGMYLIIIGKDQLYTDMPEHRNARNKDYLNERVRGTGGKPTSFGEENLLSLPIDRYDDESIGVHEFAHTIDRALRGVEDNWRDRVRSVFRSVTSRGLYENAYAGSNPGEYWAEIVQAYFDCNRINNYNHGPVGTREDLRAYDPEGYELVHSTLRLPPEKDWRYTFLQEHPVVVAPPDKFDIDPYYTKFSWAREFTVLGRQASDEALLKANDTIRKVFPYRHDILKALINDGVKMVVLGADESLSDLPEYASLRQIPGVDADSRYVPYSPEAKLLVVGEENVLGDPAEPGVGGADVIRAITDAFYHVTATRPEDPDWDDRRGKQQYELRVERLDERFGAQVEELHKRAIDAGKWQGARAAEGPVAYLAAGVLAYFDAAGADAPARTREQLKQYDPDLYALVHKTMAYEGRVDWRYAAANQ